MGGGRIRMIKYIAAILLTFIICPGFGHLILRRYKKALFLIGLMILLMIWLSYGLLASLDMSAFPHQASFSQQYQYLQSLTSQDSNVMFIADIIKALIYSYAIADIVFSFMQERKGSKK
jgi:hypothetical protein